MKKINCAIVAAILSIAGGAALAADAVEGKAKAAVCFSCHGEDGQSNTGQVPQPPRIAGQHADYLIKSMEDYASGARNNPVMAAFAANLTDEDRADLAAFYASLPSSLSLVEQSE